MNKGRVSTELVEEFELVMTHYAEIAADGEVTYEENQEHLVLLVRHHHQLMGFDLVVKWVGTVLKRGFGERREREMRRELTDPYGAMAAD